VVFYDLLNDAANQLRRRANPRTGAKENRLQRNKLESGDCSSILYLSYRPVRDPFTGFTCNSLEISRLLGQRLPVKASYLFAVAPAAHGTGFIARR
jgi:hypothetical protein